MVSERILEAFRKTQHEISKDQSLTVTISLGMATHTPENPYSQVQELLRHADEAVYFSKTHGGNRCSTYEAMKTAQTA